MKRFLHSIAIIGVLACVSCKKDKDETPAPTTDVNALKKSVVTNYSTIVYASYQDSYDKAVVLKQKIDEFVANPSQSGLNAAKAAWLNSRIPYLQTEAYRFYGGPIDGENGPEGLINSWPMDEAYLDYVVDNANAGIINDPTNYPVISAETIVALNGEGGETNIATGYHAIEFLLWGQDLNDYAPGNRPYTDYSTDESGTAKNQDRRGQYLKAAAELLVDNLGELVDAWAPGKDNYRKSFEALPSDKALENILLGMGSLCGGELAGERMQVAYDSQLQEDEHSCFSDNTDKDIVYDAMGINNVYYGRYVKTDGTVIDGAGIDDLVKNANNDLNNEMVAILKDSERTTNEIQHPFDQEILSSNPDGRARVAAAINALLTEAKEIVTVAKSIGITITL